MSHGSGIYTLGILILVGSNYYPHQAWCMGCLVLKSQNMYVRYALLVWETAEIWRALKKEIWVLVRVPLFWGSDMESPLIFYTINKYIQNTYLEYFECHWLNKEKYNFGKLNLTRLWVLVTIYATEYKALVLVIIYQNWKDKALFYVSKNPKLGS